MRTVRPRSGGCSSCPHVGSSRHLSFLFFRVLVRLCLFPALAGLATMVGAKCNRFCHTDIDCGALHSSCKVVVRVGAQAGRAPLHTCFSMDPKPVGCDTPAPSVSIATVSGTPSKM